MSKLLAHRRKAFRASAVDFDGFGNASRYFDGVSDYIDLGDSDDFSFGDSANDSPFSICAWVNMDDATNFRILTKFFAATTAQEWQFVVAYDDRLYLMLYDDDGSTRLGRRSNETYTSNQGSWIHFSCTYDGSSISSGISLYRTLVGGSTTQVDAVDQNIGSYTAMHNTTANVHIGRLGDLTASSHYATGKIADVRIYNKELSSAEIQSIADGENITTNLVGHWLKDTPSLLDHSGTNDGTNNGSAFAYDNPSPAVEFGKASRSFDRSLVQYVSVADSATFPTGAQTHACWFKPDATSSGGQSILGKWGNGGNLSFLLYYINADLRAYISGDGSNTADSGVYQLIPSIGTWHHVAFVFVPSTSLTLYVNGNQVRQVTTSIPATLYDSSAEYRIGRMDRSYSAPFGGHVCDVRMYDADLSSTDITALYNGTNVETNLIGHWLTNTDDVKDYAGVNDGTNNGSTYSFDNPLSEGEFGSASRDFNGSQYIEVTDDAAFPTGSQTWSCWVKVDNTSGTKTFVAKNIDTGNQSGGRIRLNNAQVQIYISADGTASWTTVFSSSNLLANTWYHLAMVFSPLTHLKIYIDGVEDASNTTSIPSQIYDNTAPFCIGSLDTTQQFQVGNIADVRIYDTDLTATDIFNLSRGYDYRTNLIGQWLTNKDDVDDYAGTNHGTNNGSTYSQDAPL